MPGNETESCRTGSGCFPSKIKSRANAADSWLLPNTSVKRPKPLLPLKSVAKSDQNVLTRLRNHVPCSLFVSCMRACEAVRVKFLLV